MTFEQALNNLKHENCYRIGVFTKTHANKGQLSAKIYVDLKFLKEELVFVEINNYPVPFFIDLKNSNTNIYPSIIKLKNVNTLEEANRLKGNKIYIPKNIVDDINEAITYFDNFVIGYELFDTEIGRIGCILDFVEDKNNPLYIIDNPLQDVLLPVNAIDFIEIDHNKKQLFVKIPKNIMLIPN